VPVCFALLANKQQATYERLFGHILAKVMEIYGNQGQVHTIITDFEFAAQEAFRNVFHVTVKGCTFHFGQSLIRWLQANGLKRAYEDQNLPVKSWIKKICALSLLPLDLVQISWVQWLRQPPVVVIPHIANLLLTFVPYFEVILINVV